MLKRILMNQVDASPGNSAGAAPADVPAADVPQAQGAAITMTKEAFDAAIASAADQAIAKAKDSIFADARRTFTAPKAKTKQETKDEAPTADDPSSLLALRDAFDDSTSDLKLTKGQRQLVREHVMSKRIDPSDVDGVVSDFVTRAGWSLSPQTATPAASTTATPAAPAQPTNAQPASSRGAPPAPQVPLDEMNVWTMSVTDRDAFIAKHGMKKYLEKARTQGKSISIDPRR